MVKYFYGDDDTYSSSPDWYDTALLNDFECQQQLFDGIGFTYGFGGDTNEYFKEISEIGYIICYDAYVL